MFGSQASPNRVRVRGVACRRRHATPRSGGGVRSARGFDELVADVRREPVVALEERVGVDELVGGPNDVELVLTEKDGHRTIVAGLKADLSATEAKSIKDTASGNSLLGTNSDPLIAFLDKVQKED